LNEKQRVEGIPCAWAGLKLTTLVVIGTDCICSCKSNYHTTTMAHHKDEEFWRLRYALCVICYYMLKPFIIKIVKIYESIVAIYEHVIFTWIPCPYT
jgi:hypothetical protein